MSAPARRESDEGGCGVIGIASSVLIPGRHLLQSLRQMRNRGNGKGGGAALAGLSPEQFGVTVELLREDYLLAVAYLDDRARTEVEQRYVEPMFTVDHQAALPMREDLPLDVAPPRVVAYFVRPRPDALARFSSQHNLAGLPQNDLEDELVYQNTYQLNKAFYASLGEKRAFVLSHGKDMLSLKLVGYGDDVIRAYQLEDMHAHVWIGHHRYPTKGRVWHPGGAHPFVGLHEALVHNGDFANYASVTAYLAQRNIVPLFLTDTEVSVLVFDLLHRTYGYPLEYVIEALAPTTERDFDMLPAHKQSIYRMLQEVHIHASPDGPWFFLIAQSAADEQGPRTARLIGITDTSMLRPQVFALQQGALGEPSIGFAASEKQAIDAALESLAAEDHRFWTRPDRVWNARGGSHTDGGAFVFSITRGPEGQADLVCSDKFGRRIEVSESSKPYRRNGRGYSSSLRRPPMEGDAHSLVTELISQAASLTYDEVLSYLDALTSGLHQERGRTAALEALTVLIDGRFPTGELRRSSLLSLFDEALAKVFDSFRNHEGGNLLYLEHGRPLATLQPESKTVILDARGYDPQGEGSLALEIVRLVGLGFRKLVVAHAKGQRFIGSGLGADRAGVHIDIYGSSGDYLASGIDGAEVIVHGSGQDQLAQIMKRGRLIVHGDVGQTFMYAAKGGDAFVLGNAAGRPLINAVGKPHVVINGTCLDYLGESFMAGDVSNGGGFVVLNGIAFDEGGRLAELETPYPGGNLFSLASGGAIFVRDPHGKLGEDQLNGGVFVDLTDQHWGLIRPMLEENERLFGIRVPWLLQVEGRELKPDQIYRAILPSGHKALQPEEAWVANSG